MIQALTKISKETRALSRYMARAMSRKLPAAVREKAKHHILDTVAAMVSGSRLLPGRYAIAYVATLGGTREAGVIGSRIVTSAANAALANGMLAHADETDDSHVSSHTHPGCNVVPAALAGAEKAHASGTQFLRAVVLGYDVGCRLTKALDVDAFAAAFRSCHSYGGTFGAGAAAGSLLGLDETKARFLLSYCAQLASGCASNVRDSEHIEKAFDFAGMPANAGVLAATMVDAGFTGVDDVFSGERNFIDAYAPHPHPEALAHQLGTHYEIMATNIKKWAVGSPAQAALDSMEWLMVTHSLDKNAIESITVQLPTRSARTVDNAPMPNINVQHLLALMLVDGGVSFASCHDAARMTDKTIRALRAKIHVIPSAELMHAKPTRQAIVEVTTRDGRKLTKRTKRVRGTVDNPMTREEVVAKARDLMIPILGARRTDRLIAAILDIEEMKDMTDLRRLLATAPPPPPLKSRAKSKAKSKGRKKS
ncbi:MAG: 2-methylcitrate dehydratase PrpD [Alphaproteobacteria bacterium]|jgi:2-methylcitrate dehydratase PrpD